MFAKLLKYEWQANRGLLGLLTLGAVGIGALGTGILLLLSNLDFEAMDSNPAMILLMMALIMTLGMFLLALGVYVIAVNIILLVRFYKHHFTDEGYLTFTLPVKTEHIYWSSALNITIWSIISTVVVLAVILLSISIGVGDISILEEIFSVYRELFDMMGMGVGTILVNGFTLLATGAFGLTMPLACITAGAVLAKKHKVLAAIGVYYGVSFVLSIVSTVITFVPTILMVTAEDMQTIETLTNLTSGLNGLLYAGLAVAAYFLTIHLMKKKLNLP